MTRSGGWAAATREGLGRRARRCAPRSWRARRLMVRARSSWGSSSTTSTRVIGSASSALAPARGRRGACRSTVGSETTMVSPPPGRLLGLERAAHRLGEAAGEGQAEADAGGVVGVAEALEGQEDPVPVVGRDAGAAVDDPELDPVAEPAAGQVRRRVRRASSAGRWRPGWRAPVRAGPGRPGRSGRSSAASMTTWRPSGPRSSRARATTSSTAVGWTSIDMAPACSRLMSSRLSTSAASRSRDSSAAAAARAGRRRRGRCRG